jgi:hypothetical protein
LDKDSMKEAVVALDMDCMQEAALETDSAWDSN